MVVDVDVDTRAAEICIVTRGQKDGERVGGQGWFRLCAREKPNLERACVPACLLRLAKLTVGARD